ncbi:MAG: aminotransferase [Planctomycetota bacterium]|nr:MAG: aminotransferase [Planctomycetota bacterium]
MRKNLNPIGAERLVYEIREIVNIGKQIESFGKKIHWENIGDPINKGEKIPQWMKDILKEEIDNDLSWGYSPTRGSKGAIDFILKNNNKTNALKLDEEDILFFNGLGDAIATIYSRMASNARLLLPSPCYTAHSIGESDHAGEKPILYHLDPENNWQPDIEEIRQKLENIESICGILLINPDNPTGTVFLRETIQKIVGLAKEFGLFIISDEIYQNVVFGETPYTPLIEVIEDVPAIGMKGLSKEIPWPGSRCAWLEFYNRTNDPEFEFFVQRLLDTKMSQVCATTLPQLALPKILGHSEYPALLESRKEILREKVDFIYDELSKIDEVIVSKPQGALYFTVVFKKESLNEWQFIEIDPPEAKALIEEQVKNQPFDKKFCYYLLGAKGICVVPLSSFSSDLMGFRMTLLETDMDIFRQVVKEISVGIRAFFSSTL